LSRDLHKATKQPALENISNEKKIYSFIQPSNMNPIVRHTNLTEFSTPENCFITEMLNSEIFQNFSIAQTRVAAGNTTELHTLRNTDEAYYILSGKGEMEIGGKAVGIVNEKDIVFIPRNTSQRIKNLGDNDLLFLCICSPKFEVKNYEQINER
jgi:mannose-6-phosphate isomerase-like protein (cupin superfamily)